MISLIATVLNEGASIRQLMESILAQTVPPDEIVIVDGGSHDDTVAILESYRGRLPLRLLVAPGCTISAGRNRAIHAARGDIIAVTDAGVRLEATWLEHISAPLQADNVNVVGGFFRADPQTPFEIALGATTLPLAREIDARRFLPSSRSIAFRKAAAQAAGLYPEWLDYCEDLVFDLRLRAHVGAFAFAPQALAHFRPRADARAFYRQYYRYARGDGKAKLWAKRHLLRYGTYLALLPALLLAGALLHPAAWALLIACAAVYLAPPYRRLPTLMRRAGGRSRAVWLQCIVLIPLLRGLGDVAKMLGYPAGWRWRLKQRPPDWRNISAK